MHRPVLLQETLTALNIVHDGKYIDATYGAGGHSKAIREMGGRVLALDADEWSVRQQATQALDRGITLIHGNFKNIYGIAKKNNWIPCQGILFDLGLSMDQIGSAHRGFSYKKTGDPLDMRLDERLEVKASDIITSYSEHELYEALIRGAEELYSRTIVQTIVRTRRVRPIRTVGDLNALVQSSTKFSGLQLEQTLRRVYQALYIEVNDEFGSLKKGLEGAYTCLLDTGRIVVLGFHSGHDRITKRFSREHHMTMRVVKSAMNTRLRFERSATLRILIKQ